MTREEAIEYIEEWLKDKYSLDSKDREVLEIAKEALIELIFSEEE